jgi:hypothetical protein
MTLCADGVASVELPVDVMVLRFAEMGIESNLKGRATVDASR